MGFSFSSFSDLFDPLDLAGNGNGLLGGGGGDPAKKQLQQAIDLLRQAKLEQAAGTAAGVREVKKALPFIRGSAANAKQAATLASEVGLRNTQDAGRASLGAATAGLGRRGLGASSIGTMAHRGIIGDTQGKLAEIRARLGESLGQAGLDEAGMLGGAQGQIAGLYGQQGASQAALTGQIAQQIAGVQHIPKKGLLDLASAAAPYFLLSGGG